MQEIFVPLYGCVSIPFICLVVCGLLMKVASPFVNYILPVGPIPHTFALMLLKIFYDYGKSSALVCGWYLIRISEKQQRIFFACLEETIIYYLWTIIDHGISYIAAFIGNSGLLGTFVYGVVDRALLPFGMRHLVTFPLQYTELGGRMLVDGIEVFGTKNIENTVIGSDSDNLFGAKLYQRISYAT